MQNSRRDFIKFSGSASLLPVLTSITLGSEALAKTAPTNTKAGTKTQPGRGNPANKGSFEALGYGHEDALSVAKGFEWYPLLKTGDVINKAGDKAGDCCDYLRFSRGDNADHAYLWVNHEYVVDNVLHGKAIKPEEKTKDMVDAEMKLVGGSLVEIKRKSGKWQVVSDSTKAFRLDANTEIPLVGPAGGKTVLGTLGNCGGGYTPWGSVLSGEENIDIYFHGAEGFRGGYGWGRFYQRPLEDYGWIVEIDIATKSARKLTALGRFAHEGATVTQSKDKRVVVYLGDDAKAQCLYKFVSKGTVTGNALKDKDLLVEGNLYVANLRKQEWVLLSPENAKLAADEKGRFKTQAEICLKTRDAAHVVGGTKLNRPEDVKVHPSTGDVYFTLTNNSDVGDLHGSVVRLMEADGDNGATKFKYETHAVGGNKIGFSCPDNMTFGPGDSLWVCTDISAEVMGKGSHAQFARNSMARLETDPLGNVYARHFLQSPLEAEITGPCFSPDGKNLFLSIQHPGEESFIEKAQYNSNWPLGGTSMPLSTVIVVQEKTAKFKA